MPSLGRLWPGRRTRDFHPCKKGLAPHNPSKGSPMDATTSRYPEIYARWRRDPTGFWGEAAEAIDWIEKPQTVFDPSAGVYGRWFPDGVCNTCYNAVDRHVIAGRGTQPAIIYDSPVTGSKQ